MNSEAATDRGRFEVASCSLLRLCLPQRDMPAKLTLSSEALLWLQKDEAFAQAKFYQQATSRMPVWVDIPAAKPAAAVLAQLPAPSSSNAAGKEDYLQDNAKPCEFYWKKRGCKLGSACTFSHSHRPPTARIRRELKKRAEQRRASQRCEDEKEPDPEQMVWQHPSHETDKSASSALNIRIAATSMTLVRGPSQYGKTTFVNDLMLDGGRLAVGDGSGESCTEHTVVRQTVIWGPGLPPDHLE